MGNRATHTLSCPVIVEYPPDSGSVVLVGEPKKGFSLNIPGGGVDLLRVLNEKNETEDESETLVVAAEREVLEESGLIVELTGIIGLNHILKEKKFHFTLAAVAIGGSLTPSDKHPIVKAFSRYEIAELKSAGRLRSPRVEHWVSRYFSPENQLISLDHLVEFDKDPFPENGDFNYIK